MADPDDEPIEDILARSRERAERFKLWLEHLRCGDPVFAEASALQTWDMTEWQSAVYLLSGCDQVWSALGARVLAERSIAPVHHELERPRRAWSHSEDAVMVWAAHFWNVDSREVVFPWTFEQFYFQRWITACHLRQKTPPALTLSTAARERALEDELRSCGAAIRRCHRPPSRSSSTTSPGSMIPRRQQTRQRGRGTGPRCETRYTSRARCCLPGVRNDRDQGAAVKLQRIAVGDLVLCRIKGRSVYGEVLEIADEQVNFRPLCPAAGWRHASAREIFAHWRKPVQRAAAGSGVEDESPRPPRGQLSLPGMHT